MHDAATPRRFSALLPLVLGGASALIALAWLKSPGSKAPPRARQTADELSLLIDGTAGYAMYMLDTDGLVTIWNKGAERLKGWTEAEVLGRHTALFYPADSIAAGRPDADLCQAREQGKYEEEGWRVRKDGTEFLASISITALYDTNGALRGFGKVVRDITDQRAAEGALRSNASHLRSILSTVPDAMIVIDERGGILSFSAAAERLFGFSESEVIGSNVSRLMPSPDRDRHDKYLSNYLGTGERKIIGIGRIVIGARRDGSTFPMSLSVAEAIAEDGQRLFTGFVRDLTERQRTQLRLEELQSELIHVARVSAMGTMASTLAHELNQPITAVANYVEAVRGLLVDPDPADLPMIREALADAVAEAMRAGDIVRRLRNFVARGEVDKTVEHLPSLISEAAAFGLLGAREKSIDTLFDLDAGASPVLVDKVQIQQVLINLIRNAVEAMEDAPERRLSVISRDESAGCVRVTVADTGPGVAPEIIEQLFTAFVSTKAEGMGLGLSICRTIIEANGGRIWLEPGENGGSAFHFTLVKASLEKSDG
jgi:two-component system sensor kinase FixL